MSEEPTGADLADAVVKGPPKTLVGGLVKAVQYNPQTLDLKFDVTDGSASFPVQYTGAVSDLFKEDQGVVVRGEFQGDTFHASELVVKHSEEYNVPQTQAELKDLLRQAD